MISGQLIPKDIAGLNGNTIAFIHTPEKIAEDNIRF
jgi:hypothetical protein